MMPFAGYRERYELCTPAVGFRGFALATLSDYDYIKAHCDFSKKYVVIVLDPFDEYYNTFDNLTLPAIETRFALRFSANEFAPGEVYAWNTKNVFRFNNGPWTLVDFNLFTPGDYSYGANYESKKCHLEQGKIIKKSYDNNFISHLNLVHN